MGYDISVCARSHRAQRLGTPESVFAVQEQKTGLRLALEDLCLDVPLPASRVCRNIALKLLLNAHSTLLAGRLGRFEGNWMTWVKPGNLKLIDRAIRYIRHILISRGEKDPGYEAVCHALFEAKASLQSDESIVLKTVATIHPD